MYLNLRCDELAKLVTLWSKMMQQPTFSANGKIHNRLFTNPINQNQKLSCKPNLPNKLLRLPPSNNVPNWSNQQIRLHLPNLSCFSFITCDFDIDTSLHQSTAMRGPLLGWQPSDQFINFLSNGILPVVPG